MGIRAVTSQLEISYDTTMEKTKNQSERIERNLTGKQKHLSEWTEHGSTEMWDGAHNVKHEESGSKDWTLAEAKTGLFKWDLVNASKGHGFSISITRTLKTHEIITAHTLWSSPLRKLRFWQTVDRVL